MVLVTDATALLAVETKTVNPNTVFAMFTDWVQNGELVFCDEVIQELARLAPDEMPHTWTRAVASDRYHKGADYPQVQWVTRNVPELPDPDAEFEIAAVYVLAQARELSEAHDVAVLTEEFDDRPTRMALGAACAQVGIDAVTLSDHLSNNGYPHLVA